ncbi:MAG: ABC transporter permease subunit [Sarcina sp.]
MGRIIKSELFKLFKNKTFIILCCVCIGFGGLTSFFSTDTASEIMKEAMGELTPAQEQMLDNMTPKENSLIAPGSMGIHLVAKDMMNPTTQEIFHSAFGSGIIEVLIGILIAGILIKEYAQGTIKNILAYGVRRRNFYIAKFISSFIAIAILVGILTVIPLVVSTIINGFGNANPMNMLMSYASGVICASSVSAIMMIIAILTKSTVAIVGIAVGGFMIAPNLIGALYGKFEWFDKLFELTPYYTLNSTISIYAKSEDIIFAVGVAMVTTIIALVIGSNIFEKQDIK